MRSDSAIEQLRDLESARVSVGAVGSDTAIIAESLFAALGFAPDSYRTFQLSLINAINALRNKEIDTPFYLSQNPFTALDEFHRVTPVRILPAPDDIAQLVMEKHRSWKASRSLFRAEEGAPSQSIPTIGTPTLLITRDTVDDGLIETVAEVIDTNIKSLYSNEEGRITAREYLFGDIPIPLHEGVKIYLKASYECLGRAWAFSMMVSAGRSYLINSWWLAIIPSLCIVVIALQVSLIGDWLRDKLDPKLQKNS